MVRKSLFDLVTLSGVRRDLLFYLDEGPKSLSDIKEYLDTTSPEVSPRLKELIEHDLVKFEEKKYQLTPIGKSIIKNFHPFYDTLQVFEQYWDWWFNHDASSIPDELLVRIGEIRNCVIIEDGPSDMSRTKTEFNNIMRHSKWISGVSCVFDETIPNICINALKNNVPVHVVITSSVYDLFKENFPNQLNDFIEDSNGAIYVSNIPIKISHIVTDKCLFFSLSYKGGKFDLQSNLVSDDHSSIKWGVDLFEYYRNNSYRLNYL